MDEDTEAVVVTPVKTTVTGGARHILCAGHTVILSMDSGRGMARYCVRGTHLQYVRRVALAWPTGFHRVSVMGGAGRAWAGS